MQSPMVGKVLRVLLATLALLAVAVPLAARRYFELPPPAERYSRTSSAGALKFAALGDTGTGDAAQRSVSDALVRFGRSAPFDLVLLLGDEFYPEGVESVDDPKWDLLFEKMYGATGAPFFPILGNHEYLGDFRAVLDYSSRNSRWRARSRFYSFIYPVDEHSTAQFFALDTQALSRWYRRLDSQLVWLEHELQRSNAEWKIVFGHFPAATAGRHMESERVAEVNEQLLPLLQRYSVQFYVSGHDHNLQLLDLGSGVRQVISGGGGAPLYPVQPHSASVFAAASHGFVSVTLTSASSTLEFVSNEGAVLGRHSYPRSIDGDA